MAASFSFDDDLVDGRGAYEPLVLRDGDYVHELLRPEAVESHPMRSTRRGYNRSNPFVGEEREASLWGSQWVRPSHSASAPLPPPPRPAPTRAHRVASCCVERLCSPLVMPRYPLHCL